MADSSDYESHITISSDNCSPVKSQQNSETIKRVEDLITKYKNNEISDAELEEGEISSDDDDDVKELKENLIEIDSKIVDKDRTIAVENTKKDEAQSDSNTGITSTKRKLSEDFFFEVNKKGKFESPFKNVHVYEEVADDTGEFSWSELRLLMIGDERIASLNWKEWTEFPNQDLYYNSQCNIEALCTLAEKHLFKEYDVAVLFAFHYDFVCVDDESQDLESGNKKSIMDLKSDVNISEILKTVQKYQSKWERQYPNTYVIWTLPSPPDFFKYNSYALKDKGKEREDLRVNRKYQNELSKDYYALTKRFLKEWRAKIKEIPLFPMNKVLFVKKHCYKKTFSESGFPKFPRGYLKEGMFPTKMMAMYFAYLLVEFLIEYGFYPENKFGLDLPKAEEKLLEIDPEAKNYLQSSDSCNSRSHTRSKHGRHHSRREHRRHDSNSSHTSSHRSRSHSHSRRNRSLSSSNRRHKLRSRSSHNQKTHSKSRSRSDSKTRHKKVNSKSSRRSHSNVKLSHSSRRPDLPTSHSSEKSMSSIDLEILDDKQEKPAVDDVNKTEPTKEEMSFFKTLRYLREVHEIQCVLYRRKPHTHPAYKTEKEKFLRSLSSNLPLEFALPKWDEYWKMKMEKIFEQTWAAKKDQLTIDLNKKVAFTSLHNYTQNVEQKGLINTPFGLVNPDDRHQFKKETTETITSYLKEIEGTVDTIETADHKVNQTETESKDFTLADIFKDSTSNDQNHNDSYFKKKKLTSSEIIYKEFGPIKNATHSDQNTPPTFNPDIAEDNFSSSDSEFDVDGLMENPDFLQGLEEIDKELQNAAPLENKEEKSNEGEIASSSFLPNDTNSDLKGTPKENIVKEDDLNTEFVNVLKMLFRVSKRLGPLGLSVSALYHRASEDFKNKKEIFSCLNSDSKALLNLVDKKLKYLLKENLPQVQSAIYGEIAERLQLLLKKLNIEDHDRFSKVNIHSIAAATVGQQVSEIVSFIKNTLLYHGYSQFTSDDVMNLYMSVKASQLDMEKS